MFNLLMFNVDWHSGSVRIPIERIGEFTEDPIKEKFHLQQVPNFDALKRLPCIFCEEGKTNEVVRIGQIDQARSFGSSVSLEISFDSAVTPLSNSWMYINRYELGIHHDFEFSRNHWAVKELDLYKFLLRSAQPRRPRPRVFDIADAENVQDKLISVMMPFDAPFSDVYECIKTVAQDIGLRCKRADDIWEHDTIIQDIVTLINRSRIVICDCTNRNPNVFYEAGIAHTLGRDVIIITQNENDIPFDLRHIRYLKYANNSDGRSTFVRSLKDRIQTLLGH